MTMDGRERWSHSAPDETVLGWELTRRPDGPKARTRWGLTYYSWGGGYCRTVDNSNSGEQTSPCAYIDTEAARAACGFARRQGKYFARKIGDGSPASSVLVMTAIARYVGFYNYPSPPPSPPPVSSPSRVPSPPSPPPGPPPDPLLPPPLWPPPDPVPPSLPPLPPPPLQDSPPAVPAGMPQRPPPLPIRPPLPMPPTPAVPLSPTIQAHSLQPVPTVKSPPTVPTRLPAPAAAAHSNASQRLESDAAWPLGLALALVAVIWCYTSLKRNRMAPSAPRHLATRAHGPTRRVVRRGATKLANDEFALDLDTPELEVASAPECRQSHQDSKSGQAGGDRAVVPRFEDDLHDLHVEKVADADYAY